MIDLINNRRTDLSTARRLLGIILGLKGSLQRDNQELIRHIELYVPNKAFYGHLSENEATLAMRLPKRRPVAGRWAFKYDSWQRLRLMVASYLDLCDAKANDCSYDDCTLIDSADASV